MKKSTGDRQLATCASPRAYREEDSDRVVGATCIKESTPQCRGTFIEKTCSSSQGEIIFMKVAPRSAEKVESREIEQCASSVNMCPRTRNPSLKLRSYSRSGMHSDHFQNK